MPQVLIRHPKTGEEYEIDSADFRRRKLHLSTDGELESYAEAGFRVVSMPDGSPYEGPLNDPPADRAHGESGRT